MDRNASRYQPYQVEGFQWVGTLWIRALKAFRADEMGLQILSAAIALPCPISAGILARDIKTAALS